MAATETGRARIAALPRRRIGRRGLWMGALFALLALAPLAEALGVPAFFGHLLARIMIFAVAALSLDLILGYGAMVSFGHAAFVGLGAYAVGILSVHGVADLALQIPAALAVSALFAFLTGAISLRTRGVYFIMITLAFGQMAYFFMVSLSAYGGDDGLTLPARSTLFGAGVLENDTAFYYFVLAVLVAAYAFSAALIDSRFGRVIRGTRENPVRMNAIGFAPFRYQLVAYVIAGAMAALAGVLLANQAEFVSPAYMAWQRSGELIIMVVLGGMGTLSGPIVGAGLFLLLAEFLADITGHWKLLLGIVIVLFVLFGRGGAVRALARLAGRGGAQ